MLRVERQFTYQFSPMNTRIDYLSQFSGIENRVESLLNHALLKKIKSIIGYCEIQRFQGEDSNGSCNLSRILLLIEKELTHVGEIIDQNDFLYEMLRRSVQHGMHCTQQHGPSFVVKANNYRCRRKVLQVSTRLFTPVTQRHQNDH